jgi:hypothetical protein
MKIKQFAVVISILLFASMSLVQAHTVTVEMWLDREMKEEYYNEFMWIYLQNKTFEPGDISYNATCYRAQYTGGIATIADVPTNYYDVLAVDGAISWNNITNCPDRVDNYDVWATAQSNVYIYQDTELDYFVNTTLIAPPRQYFWNTISFRAIISITVWVIIGLILFAVAYFTKSGLAVAIFFIILVIIKLLIGI